MAQSKINLAIPTSFYYSFTTLIFIKPLVICRSVSCSKPAPNPTIASEELIALCNQLYHRKTTVDGRLLKCLDTAKGHESQRREGFLSHSSLQIFVHVASRNSLDFSAEDKVQAKVEKS